MQTRWEYLTPPEFKKLAREEQICILPMGSLERHGEHVPYGIDTVVAHTVACKAAEIEPCVVFPPYWFGQVHEAAAFAGAINFPTRLLLEILETLLDQIAHNGFKKIVILRGHGGNSHLLEYLAMSQLDREVDYTLYITSPYGKETMEAAKEVIETPFCHACEGETSMALACFPDGAVKMEQQCFPEPILPKVDLSHLKGVHTGLWWYAMYPENVAESPSKATKEKGEVMLNAAVAELAKKLKAIKEDKTVPALQQEYYERVRNVRNNI